MKIKKIALLITYILPHRFTASCIRALTQIEVPWLKNGLIHLYHRVFRLRMTEAKEPNIYAYPSLESLFIRQLREDARPLPKEPNHLISPADGALSNFCPIDTNKDIIIKKHPFRVSQLLADTSHPYPKGYTATIYLAPSDYHRVHMPLTGRIRLVRYIPGKLYSVNPTSVKKIPNLFSINERVVLYIETDTGPLAVVFVGAFIVGSIALSFQGLVHKKADSTIEEWTFDNTSGPLLQQGEELGYFTFGSTVVILYNNDAFQPAQQLKKGDTLVVGGSLGRTGQS